MSLKNPLTFISSKFEFWLLIFLNLQSKLIGSRKIKKSQDFFNSNLILSKLIIPLSAYFFSNKVFIDLELLSSTKSKKLEFSIFFYEKNKFYNYFNIFKKETANIILFTG